MKELNCQYVCSSENSVFSFRIFTEISVYCTALFTKRVFKVPLLSLQMLSNLLGLLLICVKELLTWTQQILREKNIVLIKRFAKLCTSYATFSLLLIIARLLMGTTFFRTSFLSNLFHPGHFKQKMLWVTLCLSVKVNQLNLLDVGIISAIQKNLSTLSRKAYYWLSVSLSCN